MPIRKCVFPDPEMCIFEIAYFEVFCLFSDTPAFGALIDGDASVMEYIRMENLTKRKNSWRELDKKGKVRHKDNTNFNTFTSDLVLNL